MPKNDLLKFALSLSEEKLISSDIVISSFIEAVKHAISIESGLAIEVKMTEDDLEIYAVRQVKENPVGLGEISKATIEKNKDIVNYQNIDLNNIQNDTFVHEFISKISISELSDMDRKTINLINKEFATSISKIEKIREFDRFKNREGEVVKGTVSQVQAGNFIITLDGGEGFLSKNEIIPGEFLNFGDQVYVYIYQVKKDMFKYQINLSRSRPQFITGLMQMMFSEIESGLITIKGVARDPGNRSKVAVYSEQPNIDAARCCIGRDGIRIKPLRALVSNERIDIVRWDPDLATFLENSLYPIEAVKLVFHSEKQVEIVMDEENLAKAKAYRRQQIRLVSMLTKMRVMVTSEEENYSRIQEEYNRGKEAFVKLGLNELQTRLLFGHDINSIEDVCYATEQELMSVLSEDQTFVHNLKNSALHEYDEYIRSEYDRYNVDIALSKLPGIGVIHPSIFVESKNKIRDLASFALLDSEEVAEILKEANVVDVVTEEDLADVADKLVMWARHQEVQDIG